MTRLTSHNCPYRRSPSRKAFLRFFNAAVWPAAGFKVKKNPHKGVSCQVIIMREQSNRGLWREITIIIISGENNGEIPAVKYAG